MPKTRSGSPRGHHVRRSRSAGVSGPAVIPRATRLAHHRATAPVASRAAMLKTRLRVTAVPSAARNVGMLTAETWPEVVNFHAMQPAAGSSG